MACDQGSLIPIESSRIDYALGCVDAIHDFLFIINNTSFFRYLSMLLITYILYIYIIYLCFTNVVFYAPLGESIFRIYGAFQITIIIIMY